MVKNKAIQGLELMGGRLCLDFINTVSTRKDSSHKEYLQEPIDVVLWAVKAGALDPPEMAAIKKFLEDRPGEMTRFLQQALRLREALYRIFLSAIDGGEIEKNALDCLNEQIASHFTGLRLSANAAELSRKWAFPVGDTRIITAPILFDAWDLLLSDRLARVRACPNCGWLFLDRTRNGSRRWCSMQACGSSVKALDWYYRHKGK